MKGEGHHEKSQKETQGAGGEGRQANVTSRTDRMSSTTTSPIPSSPGEHRWLEETLRQMQQTLTHILHELQQIVPLLTPRPASFTAAIVINALKPKEGEKHMAPTKAARATVDQRIMDDGTASTNVTLKDTAGLPIKTLQAWPSQVAQPTETASDATPGPSAFVVTPVTPPTLNSDGSFKVATISCVRPVAQPPAQGVDFTVEIASGLVGQTAALDEDAGTLSIVGDPNQPGGFSVAIAEP